MKDNSGMNEFRKAQAQTSNEEVNTETKVEGVDVAEAVDEEKDKATEEVDNEEDTVGFSLLTEDDEPTLTDDSVETSASQTAVKSQVKLSVEEYLVNNKDLLRDYFKYKDLDLGSLTDEQIVAEGLRRKHPRWSEDDLKDELEARYGIGLSKKKVTDDMDTDEIEQIEKYNAKVEERIRNGNRYLRADVEEFKRDLEDAKNSITLPEFETEVEVPHTSEAKTIEQLQEEVLEWREKEWKPLMEDTVSKVKGVKTIVKVNMDEGVSEDLTLSYSLTEGQKKELQEYMNSYVDQPSDAKFIKEDGSVDYTGLVQEKATWLFANHIITSMVKEGIAKVKGDFIKNRLVNYAEPSPSLKPNTQAENSIEEYFKQRGAQRQSNKNAFKF